MTNYLLIYYVRAALIQNITPSHVWQETGSTNGPILYCAPTGKAANVIKKRVGKKAFTIHQVQDKETFSVKRRLGFF